jgi:hypothetical protein
MNNKPPLGVKPTYLWIEDRLREIELAIDIRIYTNDPIPIEWVVERNKHVDYLEEKRNERNR